MEFHEDPKYKKIKQITGEKIRATFIFIINGKDFPRVASRSVRIAALATEAVLGAGIT